MFLWTMFTLESFKGLLQQLWVGCAYYLVWAAKNCFVVAMQMYNVFATLSLSTDVFDPKVLGNITTKLYSILGVVVLFIVAYNFLLVIIDPDKSKGDLSPSKMLTGIAKVLIIISLLPTIFSFASDFTGSIIESGVIESLVAPTKIEEVNNCYGDSSQIDDSGFFASAYRQLNSKLYSKAMVDIFISFYDTEGKNAEDIQLANGKMKGVEGLPLVIACSGSATSCTFAHAIQESKCNLDNIELLSFSANWALKNELKENGITFHFILAMVTIIYIGWTLLTFCFDLAIRVIRIAFYQIVAPICVACSILPGGKKEIYTKWKSLVIKNYAMVLVRVMALSFAVLLLSLVDDAVNGIYLNAPEYCNALCKTIITVFLIIAVFTFAKEIPKIIEGLIGEESGLGKSLTELFKSSGMYTAGATIGGAVSGAARNAKGAFGNKANWKNKDGKVTAGSVIKNVFKGGASTVGGAASGGKRGYTGGKGAGSFKDMAQAASNAGRTANEKARKHDAFIKDNGGYTPKGIFTAFGKTLKGAGKKMGYFIGINDPHDIEQQVNSATAILNKSSGIDKSIESSLDDFAEKGKLFKTKKGLNTSELYSKKQKVEELRDKLRLDPGNVQLTEELEQAKADYGKYKNKMVEEIKQMVSQDEAQFTADIQLLSPDIKNFLLETRAQQKDLSAELKKMVDSKYIEEVSKRIAIHAMTDDEALAELSASIDAIAKKKTSYSSADALLAELEKGIDLDIDSIKAAINYDQLKLQIASKAVIQAKVEAVLAERKKQIETIVAQKLAEQQSLIDAQIQIRLKDEYSSGSYTIDFEEFKKNNMDRITQEIQKEFETQIRDEETAKIDVTLIQAEAESEQEAELISKVLEKVKASKSIQDTKVENVAMALEERINNQTATEDEIAIYKQLLEESKITVDRVDDGSIYQSRKKTINGKGYDISGASKMLKEVGTTVKAEGEYRLAEIAREKDSGSGSKK